MQSLGASQASLPVGATTQQYGSLSDQRVQDLRGAGVPEPAIAAANSVVNTAQSAQLGNVDPATVNTIPAGVGTNVQPGVAALATAPQPLEGGSLQPSVQTGSLDSQFNALTPQHVQLLRLIGLPDENIQQLAASNPNAAAVQERIIWMASNPEAVDNFLMLPAGTTAARLAQIPAEAFVNPAGPGTPNGAPPVATDDWDSNYPQLLSSHVAVFRAIGMNDQQITYVQQQGWSVEQVEALIQNDIMIQPEAWDTQMGVPPGTVRAGLVSLGAGVAANIAPVGTAPGDVAKPVSDSNDTFKALAIAGVLAVGGFLAWRHFKGKNPMAGAADAMSAADRLKATLAKVGPTGGGGMSPLDALSIPAEELGKLSKKDLLSVLQAQRAADMTAGIHPGMWPHLASGGAFAPVTDPHMGNLMGVASNMGTGFAERMMLHLERMNIGSVAKVASDQSLKLADELSAILAAGR
jgi:hypothetical protein